MKKSVFVQLIKEQLRLLNEELIGYMDSRNMVGEIYKNPKSIKAFPNNSRAITSPTFDLYICDTPSKYIHTQIGDRISQIEKRNVPLLSKTRASIPKKGVTGVKQNGVFVLSSIYNKNDIINYYSELDFIAFKLNKTFPFKFSIENYSFDNEDDDEW